MFRSVLLASMLISAAVRADPLVPVVRSCDLPKVPAASDLAAPATYTYRKPDAAGYAPELDLYGPADGRRGPRPPLVVVIHGGAWSSGSRRQAPIAGEARFLAAQGYAVAALDYSLVDGSGPNTNRFPSSTRDALCAVKWLKARSAALGFDPGRIAVMGHSSGGHLAAMVGVLGAREQAFDARFGVDPLCDDNRNTAEVAAVVAYYPVTDAYTLRADALAAAPPPAGAPATAASGDAASVSASAWNIVARYLGPAADDPVTEKAASPLWAVGRSPLPPFFLVAGARDRVVPPGQTKAFGARLDAFGHVVQGGLVGRGETGTLDHGFFPFDDATTADVESRTYGLKLTVAQVHALLQPSSCTLLAFLDAALTPGIAVTGATASAAGLRGGCATAGGYR